MPLLPKLGADGELVWVPPDKRITLCEYLIETMTFFTHEPWDNRVFPVLPGFPLPVYQAAVAVEDAARVFDVLLKPFAEQRTAYRLLYNSKNTPELDFGAEPRMVAPVFMDEVERGLEAGPSVDPTIPITSWNADVELPAVETPEWQGPWNTNEIPVRHNFVHFQERRPSARPAFNRQSTF
jgi:hypothetical protein